MGFLGLVIRARTTLSVWGKSALGRHVNLRLSLRLCAYRYMDLAPHHAAEMDVNSIVGLLEQTALLFSTLEEAAPPRVAIGRTQSRFTSTATERLSISTETTRRQALFSLINMPSTPWSGPHSTRTRSPRSR